MLLAVSPEVFSRKSGWSTLPASRQNRLAFARHRPTVTVHFHSHSVCASGFA